MEQSRASLVPPLPRSDRECIQRTSSILWREELQRAKASFEAGDYAGAAAILRRVALAKAEPDILYLLATAELEAGHLVESERVAREGLRLEPEHRGLLTRLARVHQARGHIDHAHHTIEAALRAHPTEARAISVKAELLVMQKRTHEAVTILRDAMARCSPTYPLAIVMALAASDEAQVAEALASLEPLADDASIPPMARRTLLFRLGDLLDRVGRYDDAFAAYAGANALRRAAFDPKRFADSVNRMVQAWRPGRWRASSCQSARPVFIVGMPRSGTSVLEQMLDRHSRVEGAGELPWIQGAARHSGLSDVPGLDHVHRIGRLSPARLADLAQDYLDRTAPRSDATYVVDKNPLNAEHLGLIGAMFPRARVVHCVRDAMDTCLSCYFQDFGAQVPFATDLRHLGAYHRAQARLMEHWKRSLEVPIHTVHYEHLVSDPRGTMAEMLGFLGLDFEDACTQPEGNRRMTVTASNAQVRRPIYTSSVGRHMHYTRHLADLRESLGLDSSR